MWGQLSVWIAVVVLIGGHSSAAPSPSVEGDLVVFASEQQSVAPAYPIGNVAIGNPKVADFRVMPGRRELLVFGKGVGGTTLTLWDQRGVKRDDIVITVTTRQAAQALTTLHELLRDFPSVGVRQVADSALITGTVTSKEDLATIQQIAAAMKATVLVRCPIPCDVGDIERVEPLSTSPRHATGYSAKSTGGMDPPLEIEYEIELLEASSRFRSGSFAKGIEPSGRSLSKNVVRAPIGVERELFIGDHAIASSARGGEKIATDSSTSAVSRQTGIKLTLRPTADGKGRFKTSILIETNLPFSGETYDPSLWRRARWEFTAESGEPFGITGADLLATPDANDRKTSKLGSTARTAAKVATIPGVGTAPGAEYVPVFGSLFGSTSYKAKATQLLVILRPRAVSPEQ